MSKRRKGLLISSAIGPGLAIFGAIQLFKVEAVWLFLYFAFIFTLISFMLASTFVEWNEKPDLPRRRFFERSRLKR
ncbi:MAG: hypothetical protein HYY29_05155 [Chloroflexi bacterium]|nr:hypothetical protein [Chloroflexota bacterium]